MTESKKMLGEERRAYILSLLKENNYQIEYHILAVNRLISDQFIAKRMKESGRIIYKTSADYFYEILPIGLKYICENDTKNNCFIWSAFDLAPAYQGKVSLCLKKFNEIQSQIKSFKYSESELLESKYNIIKKHLT